MSKLCMSFVLAAKVVSSLIFSQGLMLAGLENKHMGSLKLNL